MDEHTTDAELVSAATDGHQGAWTEIVRRYQPLVDAITRRYRVREGDAADVGQQVWLQLVTHIGRLREPRALPGWVATTASRECIKAVKTYARTHACDPTTATLEHLAGTSGWSSSVATGPDDLDQDLIRADVCRGVQDGLAELQEDQRDLLLMLVADPPLPYQQISRQTGRPVGSLGPTRARLLKKLENTSAVRDLSGWGQSVAADVAA